VVVLIGCGKSAPIVQIDPSLQPYVDKFVAASENVGAPVKIENLIVKFAPVEETYEGTTAFGVCHYGDTPTVVIDLEHWDRITIDDEHEILIFHELGHCLLNRQHLMNQRADPDSSTGYAPLSIMYPSSLNSGSYEERKQDYQWELFHPGEIPLVRAPSP
jgi:hypothetical protein